MQEIAFTDKGTCGICFGEIEKNYELSCGHAFCEDCIVEFLKNIIKTQRTQDLKCPNHECEKQLTQMELQFILPPDEYGQLSSLMYKNNSIHGLEVTEVLMDCVGEECDAKWIVWKDAEFQTCPQCQIKYCLKCRSFYHEGQTCDEVKHLVGKTIVQKSLFEMGFQQCPICKAMVEKIEGCNYMTCESSQCQEQTSFCYLCGLILVEEDHFDHYQNSDPMDSGCRIRGPDGGWIEKDEIQENQIQPTNPIKCPGCETIDIKMASIIKNFNSNVLICKSEKCISSFYCLSCGLKFQGDLDQEFLQHFEENYNCKLNKPQQNEEQLQQTNHEEKQSEEQLQQTNHEEKQSEEQLQQTNHEEKQSEEQLQQTDHEEKQSEEQLQQTNHEEKQSEEQLQQTDHEEKQSEEQLQQTDHEVKQSEEQLQQTNHEENEIPIYIPQTLLQE